MHQYTLLSEYNARGYEGGSVRRQQACYPRLKRSNNAQSSRREKSSLLRDVSVRANDVGNEIHEQRSTHEHNRDNERVVARKDALDWSTDYS